MNGSSFALDGVEPSRNATGDAAEDETDIIVAKVVAMVVLGVVSFILGILPVKLAVWMKWELGAVSHPRNVRSELVLSLLLSFGGGALLCTTFLHMLPEVRETIHALQDAGRIARTEFHLTELVMCCGFFTMYLVEELMHVYLHARQRGRRQNAVEDVAHRSLSIRNCSESEGRTVVENTASGGRKEYGPGLTYENVVAGSRRPHEENGDVGTRRGRLAHVVAPEDDAVVATLRGLLVVLALSVHELFEGLAVGLQDSAAHVYYLMGAVSAHKLVIAFCVGVELVSAGTKLAFTVVYVLTFAVVSPVGIGVGIALSSGAGEVVTGGVVNAVLQGLATGTLLYVVFFEVLQRQRTSDQFGLRQLLAVAAGFGLMFGLLIVVGHDHSHEHDGEESH